MITLNLCGEWEMFTEGGARLCTVVPGTVLGTLLENGRIPDPFDGMNEQAVCAETEKTWHFERCFSMDREQLREPNADLVFEGLDTLAEITLNGRPIARTDNMHRTWRIPVREYLREGNNTLRVTFSPALRYIRKAAEEHPEVTYTGGSELLWTGALRKAHYMFGWDWGPCLPDAGIWREVRAEFYKNRLEEIRIRQEHRKGEAELAITAVTGAQRLEAVLLDPDGAPAGKAEGAGSGTLRITVANPRLWWPNGLGEQPLYTLKIRAVSGDGTEDSREMRLGLRTMTVAREKDAWGESFALCCNGVQFFAMGADYIPEDNLLARVSREKTGRLLRDCRDSHFNAIRVWGGGIYPGDGFYDLCDELGLVVWQDLMFACNTYRLGDGFRENIVREAEDNIRRIRHHACIGLLCGNNEMETAWCGWQSVAEQPAELKQEYLEQFEHVLKDVCREEAPDIFYWPSSPSSGGGFDDPNDLNRGDVHDWSVWHGRRPFSDFTQRYPRFCSEFGFESFPCMDTLKSFVHEDREMNPFSQVMESHQKCHSGNATMLYYLSQTLRYPFSMEKLSHASQWLQAEAVRAGVEHWRRNRGRCMGAIYWQINDCWPVASWAGIDSAGRWKALHYMARKFFAPTAVSLVPEENGYGVFVANERREPFRGTAECTVRDAEGRRIRTETLQAECPALGSARIGLVRAEGRILQVVLRDAKGRAVSETEAIDTLPKYFPLRKAEISVRREGREITLTADTFCMGVEIQAGDARLSDNWFCLYPGEARTVAADRETGDAEITVLCLE